jgi:adenylate cyclase
MGKEIERKFLVTGNQYRHLAGGMLVEQGFLSLEAERTVRIRLAQGKGYLTVKGAVRGITRSEFEYGIPASEARMILDELCVKPIIHKYRYRIHFGGFLWEVDEFHNENQGLVIAEIELQEEDQPFPRPEWIGREVTGDPRFYNVNLVKDPFMNWKDSL